MERWPGWLWRQGLKSSCGGCTPTSHAATAKKCTKKRDAHAKLLFCQSKPIAFLPFLSTSPLSLLTAELGIISWLAPVKLSSSLFLLRNNLFRAGQVFIMSYFYKSPPPSSNKFLLLHFNCTWSLEVNAVMNIYLYLSPFFTVKCQT